MPSIIRRIPTAALATLLVLSAAAGCSGDNPVAVTAPASGAQFDGGVTFGSSGRTDGTANTTAADSESTAASGAGGVTFGSGG